MVRYAKSIQIDVQLQQDTTQGIIYPPAIKIEYDTVTLIDAQEGAEVDVSLFELSQVWSNMEMWLYLEAKCILRNLVVFILT